MSRRLWALVALSLAAPATAQTALSATGGVRPNLKGQLGTALRYRPEGDAFVIRNGTERFNRPLYGGNTAFRVDGGDRPEFVLYLPGRGGNLRFAIEVAGRVRWLHEAAEIVTRYRPGELDYEIRDPALGAGTLKLAVIALRETEGLIVRAEGNGLPEGMQLRWAFGGVSGQRGTRDGDIGTEKVPISEWFAPKPEFATGNAVRADGAGFVLTAKAATLAGIATGGAVAVGDANAWGDAARMFARLGGSLPVATGSITLDQAPQYLAIQRVAAASDAGGELDVYRAITTQRAPAAAPARTVLRPAYTAAELPAAFTRAQAEFAALRGRVTIETPDPFVDAAVASLNVAADAVWDGPQQAIMHGAIAWRAKLLGWRGPYALDALGWHDRARANFRNWFARQNTDPISATPPPADEDSNLARSEAALHSNGDMSNTHYDMNAVFVDALFRHLLWTGDRAFAEEAWPVIERHLAWEKRLFRRPFGDGKLPLYEAYAQIWASDDVQYGGGGTGYASAYNIYHNRMAARIARLIGRDPAPYEEEAALIGTAMRKLLWVDGQATFGEYRDWLGGQMLHPSAGLWNFYHIVDSQVPDAREAWSMAAAMERNMPRLPVEGAGVPGAGHAVYATSDWMPYTWSVNNVVMGENLHAALALWQAGRADAAFALTKSALLASMYMGISPGNVGSMTYLDVYRREAQRDFADGSGVTARAMVEGLFGVRPDALEGVLTITPGLPPEWQRAALTHPDVGVRFVRDGDTDRWTVTQPAARFKALVLRLPARLDGATGVEVNGQPLLWGSDREAVGRPRLLAMMAMGARTEIVVHWKGKPIAAPQADGTRFVRKRQGAFDWWVAEGAARAPLASPKSLTIAGGGAEEAVDLNAAFNDRVTNIFVRGKYRTPRSPFVSLALPAQGIGAWAGHVNAFAEIDDAGLRRVAAANGGRLALPGGGSFAIPAGDRNIAFTSQWDNYPRDVSVPIRGRAAGVRLLMAGSTGNMQSRIDNGEVIVAYTDGTQARLALHNPTTWWPIEQDYLTDDYQFRVEGVPPLRVDLKTGRVRTAAARARPAAVEGGAATVLDLPLDPTRELRTLTVRALANDVVIGLMAATLVRPEGE